MRQTRGGVNCIITTELIVLRLRLNVFIHEPLEGGREKVSLFLGSTLITELSASKVPAVKSKS